MSCTVCSVIPLDNNWVVECGATSHGPYLSNDIALRVAIAEALAIRRQGQRATVLVQMAAGGHTPAIASVPILKLPKQNCPSLGRLSRAGDANVSKPPLTGQRRGVEGSARIVFAPGAGRRAQRRTRLRDLASMPI
jgi:hypothetical protein